MPPRRIPSPATAIACRSRRLCEIEQQSPTALTTFPLSPLFALTHHSPSAPRPQPPSEIEQQKMAEKAAMLSAADRQMAEELDDVKRMNQMMLYSKV